MVKPHINFTVLCVRKTESRPSFPLRLQSSGYKASLRSVSFQRGEPPTPADTRQPHQSRTTITVAVTKCLSTNKWSWLNTQLYNARATGNTAKYETCGGTPSGFFFCTSLGWNRSLALHSGRLIPLELAPCIHFIGCRWTPAPMRIFWRRYKCQPTLGIELRFLGRRSLSIITTVTELPGSYHLWPKSIEKTR